ncbi:MAG: glycosyltransferase family 4 protein [Opitutae bacterium]|nr:glycosyltransferase family 4 protein [Opitutae bacterium]
MNLRELPRIIFANRVYWPAEAATAQLLTDLAEALAARGWPVHIIAAGTGPAERHGVLIHRTGGGERHAGRLSQALNYGSYLIAVRREITRLARPGDIVVLMTDPPLLAAAATGVARHRGAQVVHWIQDIYPEIVPAHLGAWAALPLWPLKLWRNHAWRTASRCLPVSEDMAQLVRTQKIDAAHALAMLNWAPRELDQPAAVEAVAAQRDGWSLTGKFVAAYSGNLGRVHEFATLLDAADRLRSDPEIVFLFIGDGPRFNAVRRAAESRGLANVRFFPAQPRERLGITLAAADVHFVTLLPGFERLVFPSKLAGILAAGRPALFVGPPSCALATNLSRDRCGLAFPAGDGAGVAQALQSLRADRARVTEFGRSARASYERGYTFAQAVTRWEELLRGLATGRVAK